MDRRDILILAALAAAVFTGCGYLSVRGTASGGKLNASLKAGLANASTGDAQVAAYPWDNSVDSGYECNRWTSPPWEMAKVGVIPLRSNHPLFSRPAYIGANRHKVMCDGWNGWYYDNPGNEVL